VGPTVTHQNCNALPRVCQPWVNSMVRLAGVLDMYTGVSEDQPVQAQPGPGRRQRLLWVGRLHASRSRCVHVGLESGAC